MNSSLLWFSLRPFLGLFTVMLTSIDHNVGCKREQEGSDNFEDSRVLSKFINCGGIGNFFQLGSGEVWGSEGIIKLSILRRGGWRM